MKKMKRTIAVMLVLVMAITALTGCGGANNDISVISREEGSGTRKILENVLEEYNHTVHDFSRVTCISNFGLLEQLVSSGIGITFAYAAIAENNPKLTRFYVDGWDIHREFNYVYLKNVGVESLIDYFEQYR